VVLRIGTSGYQYEHWRGTFYPPELPTREWLTRYVSDFDTVELNVTFYRLPSKATFARWAEVAPDGFSFAVKASRYLTHVLRLREPRDAVERLLERTQALGGHLGPVLLQLPPDMPCEPERLAETLDAFRDSIRVAFEPRHSSWFVDEIRALLEAHGAALVLADRRGRHSPIWRTADWTYVRFHQGVASPRPCYARAALASWLDRLLQEWGPEPDAYIYFNNDHRGCALRDAATFGELARARAVTSTRTPDPGSVRPR
jgi:uncharacterized protein YecE (DUF72 family)